MSTLWVLLLVLGSSRLLEAAAPSAPLRGASRELPQVAPSVPRIEDIYVLGERHSGTNFMRQFLEMNTKAQVSDTFCAFKHDYQNTNSPFCPTTHAATGFDRALVVIMLRLADQ
ncbi:hypothetical protein FOA52_014748 [Chlamydomonas sp. UWO 241]|nr:hypothetical protein FOA52_014748 [Chlamydomonas sp. UWO 241]